MSASEVEQIFGGSWSIDRSENFEAYLDAAGVGYLKKKMALSVSPKMTIKVTGDTIEVSITAGPKTNKSTFKLGEDYDVEGEMSGKANTTFADGKLSTKIEPKDKSKSPSVIREIVNGELVQTMIIGDVTAKRIFKKV